MELPLYQIDAFASSAFHGNPAAVCPLDRWLPEETMQAIAAENNLAETAFYVREGPRYRIRWFTPTVEANLCGHATLAAASVILEHRREFDAPRVEFDSRGGELAVEREGDLYALDFPARPAQERTPDPAIPASLIAAALGATPAQILDAPYCLCVFDTEQQIRELQPNMDALVATGEFAFIVTAPAGPRGQSSDCDFVSRFFAPAQGIPEDPVTGSAHTTLIPYWSARLGKQHMFARQISPRGGELWCENRGARVTISGRAVKYLEGRITIPGN
jgi:PhzF family phenazine biosynthesis protein